MKASVLVTAPKTPNKMLHVGIAKRTISATEPERLGGYWGRTSTCEPCRDELSCRALLLETEKAAICIIALDLINIDSAFALSARERVASILNSRDGKHAKATPVGILICCTHNHTSPQTSTPMLGFGHASKAYMAALEEAIVASVQEAAGGMRGPATIRHVRTPPLNLSVNRRERTTTADSGTPAPKKPKQELMWFEEAGSTRLGQRADGPTVPYADAVQFVAPSDAAGASPTVLATLLSFACHPVCCGKKYTRPSNHVCALSVPRGLRHAFSPRRYEQSADYVHATRLCVERATGATSVFLTGCAGDVNPLDRRGMGYAAADALGEALGAALVTALGQPTAATPSEEISLSSAYMAAQVPLDPLPSEADANDFLAKQRAWLASMPARVAGETIEPTELPKATVRYAETLVDMARRGVGATDTSLGVAVMALGPHLAIVGIEAEAFSEYALHLSNASPFTRTITVGYANGCLGYLPTHAEWMQGGYEVLHAQVVYGQMQRVHKTAERNVISAALGMLHRCHLDVAASPAHRPHRAPRPHLLAEAFDSSFPEAHDTYNSIGVAMSNRSCMYVLSSAETEVGGRLFRVALGKLLAESNPVDLGDLTAACKPPPHAAAARPTHALVPLSDERGRVARVLFAGADPPNTICQGKAHCPLVEDFERGHVYIGTHCGFYTEVDGMETLPVPPGRPAHLGPYPGGCVLRLDVATGKLASLARVPGEGIVTMACDLPRRRVYCFSWPSGFLYVVGEQPGGISWELLAKIDYPGRGEGESVHPRTGNYRPVCRALVVDPRTGKVYWTNNQGTVLEYDPSAGGDAVVELLSGAEGLSRDYFGKYDPNVCRPPTHWSYAASSIVYCTLARPQFVPPCARVRSRPARWGATGGRCSGWTARRAARSSACTATRATSSSCAYLSQRPMATATGEGLHLI